tara:strand:+ start:2843 stop:3013 length:171 start_codon:yes stop_codon:yes gene_type:complete
MKNDEWKNKLTDIQYKVTRLGGTERAFSGELYLEKREGEYHVSVMTLDYTVEPLTG